MTTESDNATALWHFVDTARYMREVVQIGHDRPKVVSRYAWTTGQPLSGDARNTYNHKR
jgi:hypothetical protein